MGANSKLLVSMREQEYSQIPMELKQEFYSAKVIFDDYNEFKDDPIFKKLYKAKKKATKELDDYKFNKRNNFK